jgi:hypothetical protein
MFRHRSESEASMRKIIVFSLALAVLAMAAPAEAKHWRYLSVHPFHGGFCTIRGPHTHKYGPTDVRLYRVVRGDYYFVGDPVPFGYAGPTYAYYGAHPVVEMGVDFGEPAYCYLEGPHYHYYAPPPQSHFEIRAGVNWYVGSFEPVYYERRPTYVVVNEYYRPVRYERPRVVVTDAPPAWRAAPPPPNGGWRGSPPPVQASQGWRGSPPPPPPASAPQGWRGSPAPGSAPQGWRGSTPPPQPAPPPPANQGWRGTPSRQPVVVAPAGAPAGAAPAPPFHGRDKRDHDRDDHDRGDHDRGDHDRGDHDKGDHGRGHGHGHNK